MFPDSDKKTRRMARNTNSGKSQVGLRSKKAEFSKGSEPPIEEAATRNAEYDTGNAEPVEIAAVYEATDAIEDTTHRPGGPVTTRSTYRSGRSQKGFFGSKLI